MLSALVASAASDSPITRNMTGEEFADWEKAEQVAERAKGGPSAELQELAFARSLVGDTAGAITAFRAAIPLAQQNPFTPESVSASLAGYQPVPAIRAIVEAARTRQVVILNEAHHVPRHRAFAFTLATELRKLGVRVFGPRNIFRRHLSASTTRLRHGSGRLLFTRAAVR
jgi:hypothetical protein